MPEEWTKEDIEELKEAMRPELEEAKIAPLAPQDLRQSIMSIQKNHGWFALGEKKGEELSKDPQVRQVIRAARIAAKKEKDPRRKMVIESQLAEVVATASGLGMVESIDENPIDYIKRIDDPQTGVEALMAYYYGTMDGMMRKLVEPKSKTTIKKLAIGTKAEQKAARLEMKRRNQETKKTLKSLQKPEAKKGKREHSKGKK
jgi:hypothetical protein